MSNLKQPGQRAYEAFMGHAAAGFADPSFLEWIYVTERAKASWAAVEQACAVPAEPEQAGKVQRIELLVQVVEWLYERGHRDAAVDMDCNWNDAPPGDETCRRLTEYLPAPPTKEGT